MKRQRQAMLASAAAVASLLIASGRAAARPAESTPAPMDVVLDRAGKGMARFLDELSAVKCTEVVQQARLGKSGKTEYEEESTFDYLVLAQVSGGEVNLVESREAERQSKHRKNLPLLVTNGFSTLALIFHPSYQANFQFTPLEDEVIGGRPYAQVQFRHIHGTRSTAALLLRGREYPIDLEGVAWIDRETGWILKISAGLESSIEDVGLRTLRTEVQYAAVRFPGLPQGYWLPATATVEVETPRQHWRNLHRFTSYKRFATSVKSTIGSNP